MLIDFYKKVWTVICDGNFYANIFGITCAVQGGQKQAIYPPTLQEHAAIGSNPCYSKLLS